MAHAMNSSNGIKIVNKGKIMIMPFNGGDTKVITKCKLSCAIYKGTKEIGMRILAKICAKEDSNEPLFILCPKYKKGHKQWHGGDDLQIFAGGSAIAEDESPAHTFRRELAEEYRIKSSTMKYYGIHENVSWYSINLGTVHEYAIPQQSNETKRNLKSKSVGIVYGTQKQCKNYIKEHSKLKTDIFNDDICGIAIMSVHTAHEMYKKFLEIDETKIDSHISFEFI